MPPRDPSVHVEQGTSAEFLEATRLCVCAAARQYRGMGMPVNEVRQLILGRLRNEWRHDFNAWSYETLMATAARTLDRALEA